MHSSAESKQSSTHLSTHDVLIWTAASEQFSTSISVTLKRSSMFRLSVRKRVVDLLPPRQLESHAAVACCLANEFEASTVDAWFAPGQRTGSDDKGHKKMFA